MEEKTLKQNHIIEEDVGIFIDPKKRALVSIALFIAVFGCNFSFRSYSVALPSIVASWSYSADLYSAGNSLMTVAMAVVTIIVARISAKTGLKKTIMAGLIIVIACDLLTMIVPNMFVFLIIRVFYGVGCGLICGQELSSLNLIWPNADRKKWVGFRGVTYSVTNIVGPTVAGLLVDHFGWRSTFVTIFVFHAVGLVIFALCCPKDTKNRFYKDTPFDMSGCVTFAAFITVTVLVCTMGNKLGWGNPIIIAGLVAIVVSLVSLLMIENKKGASAILPLTLFKKNSNFTKLFFISVFACVVNMAPVNFLSLYLQNVGGTSATASGLPFSLIYLVTLFVTFALSRLGNRVNVKKVLVFCSFVCMIVIGILASWLSPEVGQKLTIMNIIAACYGIGNAITTTTIYDAAAEYVDTADIGMATSMVYMGITFGGSVGLAVLQLLMNTWTAKADLGAGLIAVFWGSFVSSVIMTILVMTLKNKKKA